MFAATRRTLGALPVRVTLGSAAPAALSASNAAAQSRTDLI
jgi:hypothetical protein